MPSPGSHHLGPEPDYGVSALVVSGSTVYAGGDFSSIGGQNRRGIAALDATTGLATDWNPGAGSVYALAVSGSTVYAGGFFSSSGGQNRNHIVALDANYGFATAWNPGPDREVLTLAVSGSTVFAGGSFHHHRRAEPSQPRGARCHHRACHCLEPERGWHCAGPGGEAARTVYAGGDFTSIGGQSRRDLAALDATTGLATEWNPGADKPVYTLAVSGSTVYAGGAFTSIGGRVEVPLRRLMPPAGSPQRGTPVRTTR
jgi:hypothetical protein